VSEPADDVAVTPYLVKDAPRAARLLAPLLNASEDDLVRKLARRDTGFVYLARQLPAGRAAAIAKLAIPGVQLIPTSRRTYPRGWLAAQLLGGVGVDGKGLAGLEYGRDAVLHGRDGTRRMTKDALQQPIAVQDTVPAEEGKDLRLTLDAAIQSRVETVLGDVGQKYRPKGATAIVMDPRNGKILALANWPRVDANDPSGAPDYARQDRAVGFNYEPGSTFKPFTVAGALQDGVVKPDTRFELGDTIQVADRTIHNNQDEPGGIFTTEQILAQSNNVGTITIGQRLGARRFSRWVDRFGFGKPTGVDLPGEERGQVLPLPIVLRLVDGQPADRPGHQRHADADGHRVRGDRQRRDPAPAARGGHGRRRPDSVRPTGAASCRSTPRPTCAECSRVSSPPAAPPARSPSRATGSPARRARPTRSTAARACTPSPSTWRRSYGFAPASQPKLLCAVMVDEPQGAIYGSVIAAPAFGQIMAFALPYLRIPPH